MADRKHGQLIKKNVWFFDKRFSAFGAMADLGVHKTDLLIFLLETKVKKVTAVLKTLDKKDAEGNLINVDDNAICIYEMENGAVGTMTASWTYYGEEDNSTIIYGSEGILKIYDDPNYSIVRIGKDGTKIYYELDKMQTNDNQTKSGIIDSWVAAIKNDTVPEVNGKDALDAMKAIFAALESSESGQTVEITEEDVLNRDVRSLIGKDKLFTGGAVTSVLESGKSAFRSPPLTRPGSRWWLWWWGRPSSRRTAATPGSGLQPAHRDAQLVAGGF